MHTLSPAGTARYTLGFPEIEFPSISNSVGELLVTLSSLYTFGAICCTWARVCSPCLGEEMTRDTFLSGEVAIPSAFTVQFVGTDAVQLPSGFFTGFVSAAAANITNESIQIRPYLFIFPPRT